jgi:hypothetical protein
MLVAHVGPTTYRSNPVRAFDFEARLFDRIQLVVVGVPVAKVRLGERHESLGFPAGMHAQSQPQ